MRKTNFELVETFGAGKKTKNKLNIVAVSGVFKNMTDFTGKLPELISKFDPREPHVFLFAETPFKGTYVENRKISKEKVREITRWLAENHPQSHVLFSINEITRRACESGRPQSNTGYAVAANGHKAYPKFSLPGGDYELFDKIPGIQNIKEKGAWWEKRGWRSMKHIPIFTTASGHEIEYLVCKDAQRVDKNASNRILLVSAAGLYSPTTLNKMVIVNDKEREKVGKVIVYEQGGEYHDGPVWYPMKEKPEYKKKLSSFLAKHRVRLHVVEETGNNTAGGIQDNQEGPKAEAGDPWAYEIYWEILRRNKKSNQSKQPFK